MKGLILKDIYNLATLFRIYTILPILAIVISYSQHSLGMLQFLPAFIGMFATISAFAYDEQSNFDSFAMTLPINRKDMVISKYVLALVCIFASMLWSCHSNAVFKCHHAAYDHQIRLYESTRIDYNLFHAVRLFG